MSPRARRVLLALGLTLSAACASTRDNSSRALTPGLRDLDDLLAGCATDPSAEVDVERIRCPGNVALARAPHAEGSEARYVREAHEIAAGLGAQLAWDRTVVPTEAESGLVDRARLSLPLDDAPRVTLLGAVRGGRDGAPEALWCSARDSSGEERCTELIGAALGRPTAHVASARATPMLRGPATIMGRALSFPTTCALAAHDKSAGAVRCDNGVVLWWSAHATMDETVQALSAHLAASGDDVEGETFACTIAGEVAQCERRGHSIAGVTYVGGAPVAVACVGGGDLRRDSACRAVFGSP